MSRRHDRLRWSAASLWAVAVLIAGCGGAAPAGIGVDIAESRIQACQLWTAIGASPTDAELEAAVGRYGVVVLNAWETSALRRLKELDPEITVLVYKDLSSTRGYAAVRDGKAPTGVGYDEAEAAWFARDSAGERIEWRSYSEHWQMAVWEPAYQQRWAENVAAEVVAEGWDGVLADNDFARLSFYSDAVLAGTTDQAGTDQRIRDGLDGLVEAAGTRLAAAGKLLVPNVSEARLHPGRWERHSRYGGAMEENFAYFYGSGGGGSFLTSEDPAGWLAQTDQIALGGSLSLLVTRVDAGDERAQRFAYASALVRGAGQVCWSAERIGDYSEPVWTQAQDIELGGARGPVVRYDAGVWARTFDNGWVAVNPTTTAVTVPVPESVGGGELVIPGSDAVVRGRS